MKRLSKTLSLTALCAVMIIMSVVSAFADTVYTENHSVIDCANRYIDGSKYCFQIKVAKGTPLSAVTLKTVYGEYEIKLSDIPTTDYLYNYQRLEYQYSDSTMDCYMYIYDISRYGASKPTWYQYGIKLFYDYNGEHYMATDTANGSTTEGPGYILSRI